MTNLRLRNPLIFFDLETTGTSIIRDRIVEMAFLKLMPNGDRESKLIRVNPEMEIPLESSLIHGIYQKDIENEPTFKSVAKNLARFLEGADFAGFNIIQFDIPMLVEEFLRVGVAFSIDKRKLIDSQKLYHLMEKRTLAAALKFYCSEDLKGAHSADADTEASWKVLEAQVKRYDGQKVTDNLGKEIGEIQNDMKTLHELTLTNRIDLAGRMINKEGEIVFNFGKNRGQKVIDVLTKDPSYYDWIMNGDFPLDTKRRLTEIKIQMSLKK